MKVSNTCRKIGFVFFDGHKRDAVTLFEYSTVRNFENFLLIRFYVNEISVDELKMSTIIRSGF